MSENTDQTLATAHQTWFVPMTASRMLKFVSNDSFNHANPHPEKILKITCADFSQAPDGLIAVPNYKKAFHSH